MGVYLIVFIVTLLIQLIPVENDKQYLRRVILTFIPMFLFGALRVDFGLDYPTYEAEFLDAHKYSDLSDISEHSEIGYVLFERIVPTWRLLIILTSALTCIAYASVFYKCIPSRFSWIAVCLLFLAGDRLIPYLGFSLLAMSFHTSAILFMPVFYFICHNKAMTKREAWTWVISMFVLLIINLDLLFEQVAQFVSTYLDRYDAYAQVAIERGDNRSLLIKGFIALYVVLYVRFMRTTELSEIENVICRMSLLFVFAFLLGSLNFRISQYLGFAFVCGSTVLLSRWHSKVEKSVFGAITLLYLLYAFFIVWMGRPEFPYHIYHSVFG